MERLRETLDRLSKTRERVDRSERQARDLQRRAEEMLDRASPEQREQMKRWAEELARESPRPGSGAAPPALPGGAGAPGSEPGAGMDQASDAVAPEVRTEDVDASGPVRPGESVVQDPRDRVAADWYSDTPVQPGTVRGRAEVEQAIRQAARSAERGVGDRTIHSRYDRLLERYFNRLPQRVVPGAEPPPVVEPVRDAP